MRNTSLFCYLISAVASLNAMPCGLHLPHKVIHNNWLRVIDMQNASPFRLRVGVNPATAFPTQQVYCRQIGTGSEGIVEAWSHGPTGFLMAVKIIRPRKTLPIEVKILKSLPYHNTIVTCFGFLARQSRPAGDCIFLEYCPAGDLFELQKSTWQKNKSVFSEAFMWSLYSQLCSALAFLHEGIGCANPTDADFWRPVVHRDIKVENVLISMLGEKDDFSSLKLKLGDFGLSAFSDPTNAKMPGTWGTTVLWPPEQTWEGREATPAGDIWAVGCILHELAHGFPPVVNPDFFERLMRRQNKAPPMPAHWSEAMRKGFWAAKAPREPRPINLATHQHEYDLRRKRPTPKYSDALNECMMMALTTAVSDRPTAGNLKSQIDESHTAFLFEDLRIEDEALREQIEEERNEGEWDE